MVFFVRLRRSVQVRVDALVDFVEQVIKPNDVGPRVEIIENMSHYLRLLFWRVCVFYFLAHSAIVKNPLVSMQKEGLRGFVF
jgi:hypothetical protein